MHAAKKSGFNLIELLIALIIIGILAAISYPLYIEHLQKSYRSEAKAALIQLAALMEQYYMSHHTYENATLAGLGVGNSLNTDHYQIIVQSVQTHSYNLQAIPLFIDKGCGTLSLNQQNAKSISGIGTVSDCWQ